MRYLMMTCVAALLAAPLVGCKSDQDKMNDKMNERQMSGEKMDNMNGMANDKMDKMNGDANGKMDSMGH